MAAMMIGKVRNECLSVSDAPYFLPLNTLKQTHIFHLNSETNTTLVAVDVSFSIAKADQTDRPTVRIEKSCRQSCTVVLKLSLFATFLPPSVIKRKKSVNNSLNEKVAFENILIHKKVTK